MNHGPQFDPGLLADRDAWLFFLVGLLLLTGSSAGFVWGSRLLDVWASEVGAGIHGLALLGAPALALLYLLGFGFVGFPFLESEWQVWRSLLSVVLGSALGLGYALAVDPDLEGPLRGVLRGVSAGLCGSLVLYTGLSKLRYTLPALRERA